MSILGKLFGRNREPVRDEDLFAESVIAALQARAPAIKLKYDPQAFELHHVDQEAQGQRMFLYNSFVEHRRLPNEEQAQHLARVVEFIVESRNPRPKGEDALDQLLPIIRGRSDLIAVTADRDDFPYARSSRPFCESMLLMLAVDSEVSIALVTDEVLDELGVSFDDAIGIAVTHLDERGGHSFGQLADGAFVSTCGDYYDASRILIPNLLTQLPLKGNPVAIVQARSAILVTGSEDMDGLETIARCALDDFPDNERAVSLSPIEWRDGKWQPFPVLPHHPQSLRNLLPNQLNWTYNATTDALQQRIENDGGDLFVANTMVVEGNGMAATLTTWANGVPTACPLVDAVLIQEDGEFPEILRSLADVLKVCGPFEEIKEMPYPPRWVLPASIDKTKRRELTEQYPNHEFFPVES